MTSLPKECHIALEEIAFDKNPQMWVTSFKIRNCSVCISDLNSVSYNKRAVLQ